MLVRVKRKRTDDPINTLHVTETVLEQRPKKRNKNVQIKKPNTTNQQQQQQQQQQSETTATKTKKRSRNTENDNDTTNPTHNAAESLEDQATYVFTRIENPQSFFQSLPDTEYKHDRKRNRRNHRRIAVHDVSIVSSGSSAALSNDEVGIDGNSDTKQSSSSFSSSSVSSSSSTTLSTTAATSSSTSSSTATAITILNPLERLMDRAIYNCFVRGGATCDELFNAVSMGGQVNFQRKMADNSTALMAAAHCARPDIVRALLELGARPLLCDEFQRTALDFAIHSGHGKTIRMLEECSSPTTEMEEWKQFGRSQNDGGGGSGSGGGSGNGGNNMQVDHLEVNDDEDENMVFDYFVMQEDSNEVEKGNGNGSGNGVGDGDVNKAQAFVQSYHFSLFEKQQKEAEEEQEQIQAWMMEQEIDDEENMNEEQEFDENHENATGNDYGKRENVYDFFFFLFFHVTNVLTFVFFS
mgnify:CR=1 FL=1